MENIIALGLLYRYIATGERIMSEDMANSYIKAVKNGLAKLYSTYDVKGEEDRFSSSYELSMDEESGAYSFQRLDYDFGMILFLVNKDLLTSSLSTDALDVLGVKLEDIPAIKKMSAKAEQIEVFAMSSQDARNKAEQILTENGFSDLRIGNAIPSQSGDKSYKVVFSGKHEALELDYDATNNKFDNLRLELVRDKRRAEIAPSMDYDNEVELENLLVADTILMDGDIKLARSKRIVFPLVGKTHASYFADFFDDSIMSLSGSEPLNPDDVNRVVRTTRPLDEEMQQRYASIADIEEFASSINKQTKMKNLRP